MSEPRIDTILAISYVKDAFGSYKILDDIELEDLPAVLSFAKIVSNYLKMREIYEKGI